MEGPMARSLTEQVEAAQAALLAHSSPGARVRRLAWSGGTTQVIEIGEGPPLLLIHGGLGEAAQWASILPALARGRRVLAVDRPGHGLADPFDYRGVDVEPHACRFLSDVLDGLGLDRTDVVANSMGGLWSVFLALRAPERFHRLVLIGAPAGMTRAVPGPLRPLGLPLIGAPLGRLAMSRPTEANTRAFWGRILVAHPERLDPVLLAFVVAAQKRNLRSMVSFAGAILDAGGLRRKLILGERWRDLRVPSVFIWGERDGFGPPDQGEAVASGIPGGARVIRIPDAGHLTWLDAPDAVLAALGEALEPTP